jgi:hypothetical protein
MKGHHSNKIITTSITKKPRNGHPNHATFEAWPLNNFLQAPFLPLQQVVKLTMTMTMQVLATPSVGKGICFLHSLRMATHVKHTCGVARSNS